VALRRGCEGDPHTFFMENIMLRILQQSAVLLLLALGLGTGVTAQAGDTLDRVVDSGTLVVGTSADQPPMTALNRQGNYMGLDIDLAKAIANAMRVQLEIKTVPFGELMDALAAGEVDMVLSGVSITPKRARRASFVGPYMLSGKSIVARRDAIEAFASGQLSGLDVKLVALKNSTSAEFIRDAAPNAQLVEAADTTEAVRMVISGEAAGMVADEPTCILAVLRNPDAGLVTLDEPLTVEPMGIATNANDPEFYALVSNYVKAYEGTGLLAILRKKWLEDSSWIAALP
jgi:ABC-type amino acid transport substrate-binding protein